MIGLEIKGITKKFGEVTALQDVTLSVEDGELFFLLGPSGCGKTTLLRIIAGFCTPDFGEVVFHREDLLKKPPEKRNIGMVFQSYSLWPHMSVFDNVAYGLKIRGSDAKEIERKVSASLKMVDMKGYEERKPAALSGGQQQRIALARALIYEPEIVLLDEPLSNLDAKLRKEMRSGIKELHARLGLTMIYVTHDQEEAAAMADRIALLNNGLLVQVDAPEELYNHPRTVYAAEFFGNANIFKGVVSEVLGNGVKVSAGDNAFTVAVEKEKRVFFPVGTTVTLVIRPENIVFSTEEKHENILLGTVTKREFVGSFENYTIDVNNVAVTIMSVYHPLNNDHIGPGDAARLYIHRSSIHLIGGKKL